MTTNVTLNIVDSNNISMHKTFTINVENKKFINSIIDIGENNTITEEQVKILQAAAARSGKAEVLEACDLNSAEKLKMAELNGFSKYYDIKLSNDGKMFHVTIKDAGMLVSNPVVSTIKADFGVRDNVLVQGDDIPYGNFNLLEFNERTESPYQEKDYNRVILKVGDTINIPADEVNISDKPKGFWGRLIQ